MSSVLYSSIDDESVYELEEKRSVFIGYAYPVSSEKEAKEYIQRIKSKHHDARHNCSAYLLRDGYMRYSDDGEPQGTAGIPILEVIKKSGLVDVVVVVTRYFGGILLGAGGLVRAYSAAAGGVLTNAQIVNFQKCISFQINVDYSLYDKLTRHLSGQGVRVINTEYNDRISIQAVIAEEQFKSMTDSITDAFSGKLSVEYIEELIERV